SQQGFSGDDISDPASMYPAQTGAGNLAHRSFAPAGIALVYPATGHEHAVPAVPVLENFHPVAIAQLSDLAEVGSWSSADGKKTVAICPQSNDRAFGAIGPFAVAFHFIN